jgi:hypothetical protein
MCLTNDPDSTTWRLCWYRIGEEDLRGRLPALAEAMRPHWYAHFFEGDDLCVILAGRHFWVSASNRATWQDFLAHGDTVGVDRRWTENVPTKLPPWVLAALAQAAGQSGTEPAKTNAG